MDQRQIVKRLEEHIWKGEQELIDHRNRLHEERISTSDEEWWAELIERTRSIRPQMIEVFERNKDQMIAKRFQTVDSEKDFRERMVQKRVMELLPHVSAVRAEMGLAGELTDDQIKLAEARMATVDIKVSPSNLAENKLRPREELN